jgi:transcription antitermination factor NusG
MSDPSLHPWYALKVRTRGESLVSTALQRKDYETFLPTYKETRQYSDRIKKVDAPLFPGYLFCRLDVTRRLPVLTTPGVDYILGSNGEPEPLPEEEIAAIERVIRSGAAARPWPFLKTGSRVRVEHGAFTGVEGILLTERGSDRLVLSITMLQRSVSVEIDRTWIRPL